MFLFYVVLNVIKNYKITKLQNNKVFTTPRTEREIVVFVISIAAFLLQNKNKSFEEVVTAQVGECFSE